MNYSDVAGGDALLNWFGEVPSFHDAEIVSLSLNSAGRSALKIHGWIMTDERSSDGHFRLDRHAVVTFSMTGITDLRLDGFSSQNVIAGLILRRASDRGGAGQHGLPQDEDDIEIELRPCYGMDGFIRAKTLEISFEPGQPGED
ncbi:Imm50 family immunity protein [Oceanicella sp. SM1341]|uniref:Imm50 family immunity protein n=1 Tax=Oceanicella sp. SM1341 TaxID=1548889 RepID=UPI000E509675|nr:Imm50 family immunity protein [Oceanicella sp. SM1341]